MGDKDLELVHMKAQGDAGKRCKVCYFTLIL